MPAWSDVAIVCKTRFSPCLSRKRQSWGACDSLFDSIFPLPVEEKVIMGTHGNMACSCESLFPLPVAEKAVVGCLRFAFPPASRGKGLPRDSAGLCGWGAHGAPQCSEGLRGAPQGSVAWNCLSFDRQGEMAITGTLVWGVVQDCLFTDRQREKGLRPPKSKPPSAPAF